MHCPICNSIDIGKVGTDQYYCWHCLIEFSVSKNKEISIYYVEDDGSLVNLDFSQMSVLAEAGKAT